MAADSLSAQTVEAAVDDGAGISGGSVRPMRPDEARVISVLMKYLGLGSLADEVADIHIFVWERARQSLGGFIACSVCMHRDSGPVSGETNFIRRIEGLWIASFLEHADVARALRAAADAWIRFHDRPMVLE